VALIDKKPAMVLMTLVIAAVVILKHRGNIKRLRDGSENKFKA
jgi:acyl phosphate:glycerol-3-phosphate acyltransferase